MSCGYNCEYSCEECDVPDKVIEFVNVYNQALEDFVKKCENAKFYQFGQHYVDIRDIREFKKELSR